MYRIPFPNMPMCFLCVGTQILCALDQESTAGRANLPFDSDLPGPPLSVCRRNMVGSPPRGVPVVVDYR